MSQDDDDTESIFIDATIDINPWEAVENIVVVGDDALDEMTVTDDDKSTDVKDELMVTL